jgi:hypothetical protein
MRAELGKLICVFLYSLLHCGCDVPGHLRLFLPQHLLLDEILGHRMRRDCPELPWPASNNDELQYYLTQRWQRVRSDYLAMNQAVSDGSDGAENSELVHKPEQSIFASEYDGKDGEALAQRRTRRKEYCKKAGKKSIEAKVGLPRKRKEANNERSSVCSVLFRRSLTEKLRPEADKFLSRLHPLKRTQKVTNSVKNTSTNSSSSSSSTMYPGTRWYSVQYHLPHGLQTACVSPWFRLESTVHRMECRSDMHG